MVVLSLLRYFLFGFNRFIIKFKYATFIILKKKYKDCFFYWMLTHVKKNYILLLIMNEYFLNSMNNRYNINININVFLKYLIFLI